MIHVVLVEPEIPPNTGNIARTCAATGLPLHLVEPLGFSISDRHLRRAGLDYWQQMDLKVHHNLPAFFSFLNDRTDSKDQTGPTDCNSSSTSLALLTTKAIRFYTDIPIPQDETEDLFLLFGPETRGLPADLLARFLEGQYRIPMVPDRRSLNLSNSVAVVVYELLRKQQFRGLT
ncbi:MAG: tRNA (cytidine(34)-2'-O)-methyltransferase [Alkalispirochaeta sp.]